MRTSEYFFLFLIACFFFNGVFAHANESTSVNDLIRMALNRKLDKQSMWHRLVHYKNRSFVGIQSDMSDPRFFLSSVGRTHSESELSATLNAFFSNENKEDSHGQCRFPARFKWLKKELFGHPAWGRLPHVKCLGYENFLKNLNAESISFVFSSFYANNPSSSFGHTFFRVNTKSEPGRTRQELLDYSIGYAADVTTDNSILYVIKGLTGGFRGTLSVLPYYYKVREYSNYERRDLWSYRLNLTAEELARFLDHVWEVAPHYFNYYFLTQNCSYPMLSVLEASSERINLFDKVHFYVIPSDVIRALHDSRDMVADVEFRPSHYRLFETTWLQLDAAEKDAFVRLVDSYTDEKLKGLTFKSKQRKALFYEALVDYADVQGPYDLARRQGKWFQMRESALIARASIPLVSDDIKISLPEEERPELSHPSSRIGIGVRRGEGRNERQFRFRFGYHDFLDYSVGLPLKTQMDVGAFDFFTRKNELYLDSFSLFRIFQINPLTQLMRKYSWGIDVGVKSVSACRAHSLSLPRDFVPCLGTGMQIFGGAALGQKSHTLWMMPFIHYRYSDQFTTTPNYLAVGYQLGYLFDVSRSLKVLGTYTKEIPHLYGIQDSASIIVRYNFVTEQRSNSSLEVAYSKHHVNKSDSLLNIFGYYYF